MLKMLIPLRAQAQCRNVISSAKTIITDASIERKMVVFFSV
jgi:hypothetical protein